MVSKAGGSGPCVGLARPGSLIPTASSRFRHQRGGGSALGPGAPLGQARSQQCQGLQPWDILQHTQ